MRLIFLLAITFLVSLGAALAQSVEDPAMTLEEEVVMLRQVADALANDLARAQADAASYREMIDSRSLPDGAKAVQEKWLESWIDRYQHEIKLRRHALEVLQWQSFAAYMILFMVLAVTGLGVYLSYIEVKASLATPEKALEAISQETSNTPTELVVSFQKLQVTSAVIGVVILVLSLGFLYLFLDRVFELKIHDFSGQAMTAGPIASMDDPGQDPESSE